MNTNYETLIRRFAEGSLTPDAQLEFDRLFEADPVFASQATEALGERLGPAPEAFLDRVTVAARPGLEEAWKIAGPKVVTASSGFFSYWPVAALAGAFFAVLGTGAFLVLHKGSAPSLQVVPGDAPKSALPALQDYDQDVPRSQGNPSAARPSVTAVTRRSLEGTAIRIQDLPADPSVTVDILGSNGSVLRRLYQGPWQKDQTLDWDGQDSTGRAVAPGPYRAKVTTSTKTYVSEFTVQ